VAKRGSKRAARSVVVIGGANIDIKARIAGRTIAATSNPAEATFSAGGVGRNIAHNLARLGIPGRLISAVGDDVEGGRLLQETAKAGVDVSAVKRARGGSGLYAAVLDHSGELVIGVSAMSVLEKLTATDLARRASAIDSSAFIVADCNLRPDCLKWLVARAKARGIPILLEPVSAPKAEKLLPLLRMRTPIHTLTPNLQQLEVLAHRKIASPADLRHAANALHDRGVAHVLVGMGAKGAALSFRHGEYTVFHRIPAAAAKARDVTGGGDALVAGYVAALIEGRSPLEAALFGQAAAGLAVAATATVSPKLNAKDVWRRAAMLRRRMQGE
jgi:pseudouridine kinase